MVCVCGVYRGGAERGLLQFKVTAVCFFVRVCVWGLCGFLDTIPVQLLSQPITHSPMQLEITQTGCVLLKPVQTGSNRLQPVFTSAGW